MTHRTKVLAASLIFTLGLGLGTATAAELSPTQLLLEPLDAMRAVNFEWKVIQLPNPVGGKRSTADVGDIVVNTDMAKLFKEGFVIYSITVLNASGTDGLLVVMTKPKVSK